MRLKRDVVPLALRTTSSPLVTRREWQQVLIFALLVTVVLAIPYAVGLFSSTPDQIYNGFVVGRIGLEDGNSYLAKMLQGAHGIWLGFLPHNAEPQTGTLFFIFYRLLGMVSQWLGWPMIITYHLARVLLGILMILMIYRFIAEFVPATAIRFLALILVVVSGGTAWLSILSGQTTLLESPPLEIICPEAFAFWFLYTTPHLVLAYILLLSGALNLWWAGDSGSISRAILAGVIWLGMAVLQPVYTATAAAMAAAMVLARSLATRRIAWRQVWAAIIAVPIAALMVVYSLNVFATDPVYHEWASTQTTFSAAPTLYLATYAIPLVLSIGGVIHLIRQRRPAAWFVLIWFFMLPFLIYAPTAAQRRLIISWPIALNVLAAYGVVVYALPFSHHFVRYLRQRRSFNPRRLRRWCVTGLVILTTPTYMLLLLWNTVSIMAHSPGFFYSRASVESFDWLNQRTTYADGVLAAYPTDTLLPAYAAVRVMAGHNNETAWVDERKSQITQFFQANTTDAWRRDLLTQFRLNYVYYGPEEQSLGGFDPRAAPYLKPVFVVDNIQIFRFEP